VHIGGSCPAFHPPVPPSLSQQGCSQSLHPQPVLILGVASTQMQDPALGLVEPLEVHTASFWSLSRSLFNDILNLRHVNCTTQLSVVCSVGQGIITPAAVSSFCMQTHRSKKLSNGELKIKARRNTDRLFSQFIAVFSKARDWVAICPCSVMCPCRISPECFSNAIKEKKGCLFNEYFFYSRATTFI